MPRVRRTDRTTPLRALAGGPARMRLLRARRRGARLPLAGATAPAGASGGACPTRMATLSAKERAQLPDSAFAYIDSSGKRRLPIHDASHVRNALARFGQV